MKELHEWWAFLTQYRWGIVGAVFYMLVSAYLSIRQKDTDRIDDLEAGREEDKEKNKAKIYALEEKLKETTRAPDTPRIDPIKAFQDWIVLKSKELLALQTEIEFGRWKESVLQGIVATIKPEYNWQEKFEGSDSIVYRDDGKGVMGFCEELKLIYERWLEGMRRTVSADHLRDAVPTKPKPPLQRVIEFLDKKIQEATTIKTGLNANNAAERLNLLVDWKNNTTEAINMIFQTRDTHLSGHDFFNYHPLNGLQHSIKSMWDLPNGGLANTIDIHVQLLEKYKKKKSVDLKQGFNPDHLSEYE